jgi:hypothetical protein
VAAESEQWVVHRDDEPSVLGRFATREAALREARTLASAHRPSLVFVQKPIQTFEIEHTFLAD